MNRTRVIIMGAAGRDFHNFNMVFRDNNQYEVVCFTATQIPDIAGRKYPAELAGQLYPEGIPIYDEADLLSLIKEHQIDEVVFSYSDVSYQYVMSHAAAVMAAGANFRLLGCKDTMIKSNKPVIAITAVRTGAGKSQTTRRVSEILKEKGKTLVAVRHPMPYGDLAAQKVQRFATHEDLDTHECTIEEREEYEPHLDRGTIVYAGVDYAAILAQAEQEADVILWDGGNNDLPFYKPDLWITIADPHRPGDETSYFPGESNVRGADVVVLNKIETAYPENVKVVRDAVMNLNPEATIIEAASPLTVEEPELIRGKRVLVVEDGPTLTHGNMKYGAGVEAAKKYGAAELVDPRPFTVKSITETYEKYPDIGTLLPAMGYGKHQMKDLEKTIDKTDCDTVVIGTPIDLAKLIKIKKPCVRVRYDLQEIGTPTLDDVLKDF
ncbi:MAG: GTPase [Gemmatimonadetes bacterium]|nr:MAG: GTPase [Gemmatimonadota bacterium]